MTMLKCRKRLRKYGILFFVIGSFVAALLLIKGFDRGAMTLGIMTFSIMTFGVKTLSK